MTEEPTSVKKIIAVNRKARFSYFIEDTIEAGLMLKGSEVKSIRLGSVNIADAYAAQHKDGIYLMQSYISELKTASRWGHEPMRPRKLLLHKQQIRKLFGKLKVKGYSLVPLSLYFNNKNIVKVELAVVKGKKEHDKRETIKERDWQRQKTKLV